MGGTMTKRPLISIVVVLVIAVLAALAWTRVLHNIANGVGDPVGTWTMERFDFMTGSNPRPPKAWTIELDRGGTFSDSRQPAVGDPMNYGGTWTLKDGEVVLNYEWSLDPLSSRCKPISGMTPLTMIPHGDRLVTYRFERFTFCRIK
jgi:hypothetical protein